MIMIDCPQGSPEWHAARCGVITASRFRDACDRLRPAKGEAVGKLSARAISYAAEVALEIVTGETAPGPFVTYAMKRGTELEPEARLAYEARTGYVVHEAGVALTEDRRFGYSTDGFVDPDGAIEIKCPSAAEKLIGAWRDRDLSEYVHQIQGGLWLTGRRWCDFVMYAPQLVSVGKHLLVIRVERDEAFIEQLEQDLLSFMRLVDENVAVMREPVAA